MENGEHLTDAAIEKIVNNRASINTGLSQILKADFPRIIPVTFSWITNNFTRSLIYVGWRVFLN